jgi:hypothetical protein
MGGHVQTVRHARLDRASSIKSAFIKGVREADPFTTPSCLPQGKGIPAPRLRHAGAGFAGMTKGTAGMTTTLSVLQFETAI